jgi:argininosuccinate lyase
MKLWDKGTETNKLIEAFTIGKDTEMDYFLAEFDVLGSLAHIKMLESIGLLTKPELTSLESELKNIYREIKAGNFVIEEGSEDVHSQIELLLTRKLGDTGKKIHSGRSRNDQVLVDLKLFARSEIQNITLQVNELFNLLISQSDKYQKVLMPGYTHLQVAMPSSFGLWFGAYAESLTDDLILLQSAYQITDQNPLGSAAGYGSSFPLNRQMTTDLLGFNNLNYNVIYAQMGRGKAEKIITFALSSIAATLSRLAYDVCLFMSQNFNFVSLPDELTTGSSIMPHKKNPDVFELLRSHCNKLQGLPNQILLMTNNLPSGYFRDLQLIKELFIPAFGELKSCLSICSFAVANMKINENILADKRYENIYSVEAVNELVVQGTPFREAYKEIRRNVEARKSQ